MANREVTKITMGEETFDIRDATAMHYHGSLPTTTDFNDVAEMGYYYCYIPNTYVNVPVPGTVGVLSVWKQGSVVTQEYVSISTGERLTRYRSLDGTWTSWRSIAQLDDVIRNKKAIATDADWNTITVEGLYYAQAVSTYTNAPLGASSGNGGIIVVTKQGGVTTQDFYSIMNGRRASRWCMNSEWRDWREPYALEVHDKTAKYFAFGDSTTYGQRAGTSTQSAYNYPAAVGKALGFVVDNQGVKGQGLLKDWDTINSTIDALDMTGASLITVAWAYNDSSVQYRELNFGTPSDTTEESVIGKYYTIMKKLQEKCPTAQVVLITGFGFTPTYPDKQFTTGWNFGDGNVHTAQELYNTLEEMCNLRGWSCINQAKGCWVTHYNWDSLIGNHNSGGSDRIHPTTDGYIRYSSYIVGKLSALNFNLKKW